MSKKYVIETGSEYHRDSSGLVSQRDYSKVVQIDPAQDPFYLTFLNYVGWMYDIRGNVALNVMSKLMEYAEFNTGVVTLSPSRRKRIMEDVGIEASALSRALKTLVSKGALREIPFVDKKTGEEKKNSGEYLVNPEMFWKGELSKRNKLVVEFRTGYVDDDNKPSNTTYDFEQNSSVTNDF